MPVRTAPAVRGGTSARALRPRLYQRGASQAQTPNTACAHQAQARHKLAITRTTADHFEFATAAPKFHLRLPVDVIGFVINHGNAARNYGGLTTAP